MGEIKENLVLIKKKYIYTAHKAILPGLLEARERKKKNLISCEKSRSLKASLSFVSAAAHVELKEPFNDSGCVEVFELKTGGEDVQQTSEHASM